MEERFPPHLEPSRQAVLEEIGAAFQSVVRGDGVSWNEAEAVDGYGSESQRRTARREDRESGWRALVDMPDWDPEVRVGGFSFLDALGFRYYLPAAMSRCTQNDTGWWEFWRLSYSLRLASDGPSREHDLQKWTLLDLRQRRCVFRFLSLMAACVAAYHEEGDFEQSDWTEAIESYWGRFA